MNTPSISEVSVTRKFNLGNYETIDLGLHCFIGEGEDPQQAFALLEQHIMAYVQKAHPEALGLKQPPTVVGASKPQQLAVSSSTPVVHPQPKETDIAQLFPEDLRGFLSFEQKGDQWVVKPRQFLGPENFGKIAEIVKAEGGRYISEGKNSRFEIPIK